MTVVSYSRLLNSELIIQNSEFSSFRCFVVKVYADDQESDIGYPDGYHGRHIAIDGKGRRYGLEYNVAETEGYANAKVEAHAALDLLDGERQADEREDEGGK